MQWVLRNVVSLRLFLKNLLFITSTQSPTIGKMWFYSKWWGLKCFRLRGKSHSHCQLTMQAPIWSVTRTSTLPPFLRAAWQRMLLVPLQPPQPQHPKADPLTVENFGLVVLVHSSVFWHLPLYLSLPSPITSQSLSNFSPRLSGGFTPPMYLRKNAEGEENPKPQVAQWKKKKAHNCLYRCRPFVKKSILSLYSTDFDLHTTSASYTLFHACLKKISA